MQNKTKHTHIISFAFQKYRGKNTSLQDGKNKQKKLTNGPRPSPFNHLSCMFKHIQKHSYKYLN